MKHLSNHGKESGFLHMDSKTLNGMSHDSIGVALKANFEQLFPDELGFKYAALLIKERVELKEKKEKLSNDEPNASPFFFTKGEIIAMAEDYNTVIHEELDRCQRVYNYLDDWDFQKALEGAIKSSARLSSIRATSIKDDLEPQLKRRCRHKDRYPEDYDTIDYLSGNNKVKLRVNKLLYGEFKPFFIATLSPKATLRGAENMDDLFQEVLIVLKSNVDDKRFRIHEEWLLGLTCAVTSFLISVGKNMAFKKLYKEKNSVVSDLESVGDIPAEDESLLASLYRDIHVIILGELLNELEEKMKKELEEKMKKDRKHINRHTLIMLTHFDDSNNQALIAKMLGYKSAEVVKVTLHRVHRKLKKRLEEELLKRDLGLLSQKELIEKFFGDLNDA